MLFIQNCSTVRMQWHIMVEKDAGQKSALIVQFLRIGNSKDMLFPLFCTITTN